MTTGPLSRRALIAGIAGLAAYGLPLPAAADYLQNVARRRQDFTVRPREDWAGDGRAPKFGLEEEDVRLLVVHHTLIPGNGYREDQVAKLLRDIYDFHTGPEKKWADTAYNFMVDQYGGIWETREGSLAGPVVGSATGGNQGSTQLCCFLGDLSNQPPTEAATASMAWLLALLADRYEIDTAPGATVTVTSRGSSRYAEGAEMTLSTLSGHRDVSLTACPGDAGYAFLQGTMPELVNAARASTSATSAAPATTQPSTTVPATTTPPTTAEITSTTEEPAATTPSTVDAGSDQAVSDLGDGSESRSAVVPLAIGAAAVVTAGVGILAVAKRRSDEEEDIATGNTVSPEAITPQPTPDANVRDDGSIDVPARLGLSSIADPFDTGSIDADPIDTGNIDTGNIDAGPITTVPAGLQGQRATMVAPVPVPPLPGPQRVWWAVEGGAPVDTERAIEELSREIHQLAVQTPTDLESDRVEWSRADLLLTKRADRTAAAIVAARADAVFVLRSEACLVIVTRPDGVEKRDFGKEALSVARGDVARIAVHFQDESNHPDIEVTA